VSSSRETATATQADRRYHDGEWTHPKDVSDPAVRQDETSRTLRERIWANKALTIAALIFASIVLFLLARFLPGIVSHPLVQLGALITGVFTIGAVVGLRQSVHRDSRVHELVLDKGDDADRYYGRLESGRGNYLVFVPHKGFTATGRLGDPYSLRELDPDLARMYQNMDRDPGETARIRLNPEYRNVTETDTGVVVSQHSQGLTLSPFDTGPVLKTRRPNQADETALDELQTLIRLERSEVDALRDENQTLRRNKRNAERRARRRQREVFDDAKDFITDMADAFNPRHRRSGSQSPSNPGPSRTAQELKDEVQNND
jgi:hypothetical protein